MNLGPRFFMWLIGRIGRGIPFRSTNEHVPSLLRLANRVPHGRILGLVGGGDQIISFLGLDPVPDQVVGFDVSELQLALVRTKVSLIRLLDFERYRDFATHRMPPDERRNAILKATDGLTLPPDFRRVLDLRPLMPGWARRLCRVPWMESAESYERVRRHLDRLSFESADLGRTEDFKDWVDFDLVYVSNVLRWCYTSRDFVLPPALDRQPSSAMLERMDRSLKPGGHHLFLMNVLGRPAWRAEDYEDRLVLSAPSLREAHPLLGPVSFCYCLCPRGTRIRYYTPLSLLGKRGLRKNGSAAFAQEPRQKHNRLSGRPSNLEKPAPI